MRYICFFKNAVQHGINFLRGGCLGTNHHPGQPSTEWTRHEEYLRQRRWHGTQRRLPNGSAVDACRRVESSGAENQRTNFHSFEIKSRLLLPQEEIRPERISERLLWKEIRLVWRCRTVRKERQGSVVLYLMPCGKNRYYKFRRIPLRDFVHILTWNVVLYKTHVKIY